MTSAKRATLAAAALAAAAFLGSPSGAADDVFPLSQVKRGMKGEVRTVFHGTEIGSFPFEVLDVLRNWMPGQDVILVMCRGEAVEKTGIVAGMSGSPCLIDGKVVGALAYGWPWSKEPLGGITPIESMLAVADRPPEKKVERPGGGAGFGSLVPIETPLFVSARSERVLGLLEKEFARSGLRPLQAGNSGGAFRDLDAPLVPGAAIAVVLMDGDMEAYAVGTVTYVSGDKVLAFGHPFEGQGEYPLPVANAWVYGILSRVTQSFKISAVGKTLGTLVQDRQACIMARTGEPPRMIPMTVTVRNPRVKSEKTLRVRIAEHRTLTAGIASSVLAEALDALEPGPGEIAQDVRLVFKPKGFEPVNLRMFFSKDGGWGGLNFLGPLRAFLDNEFEQTSVEEIRVEAEVVHEGRTGRLTGLSADRTEWRAGDTVPLSVEVTPYRKPPFRVALPFALPASLEPGSYVLHVLSADEAPLPEETPMPEDVPSLLAALKALNGVRADRLVVALERPGWILQHRGRRYFDLPASALFGLLPRSESGGFKVDRRAWTSDPLDVGLFLQGSRDLRIVVRERAPE
ncbi:MAG: hypothetical protein MUC63_09700 [Planctomycetes bacterium]|jgi:hypothetical protein|nr:hypothetical protein [Planctomycetota bacterium]